MNSKTLKIISAHGLLAVIGDSIGFYTVKVSHIRLVESMKRSSSVESIEVRHEEVPVIPWRGKLIGCDEVPDFLGVASNQHEVAYLGLKVMSKEGLARYDAEQRANIPISFSEMTRRSEAERARSGQGASIAQNAN